MLSSRPDSVGVSIPALFCRPTAMQYSLMWVLCRRLPQATRTVAVGKRAKLCKRRSLRTTAGRAVVQHSSKRLLEPGAAWDGSRLFQDNQAR